MKNQTIFTCVLAIVLLCAIGTQPAAAQTTTVQYRFIDLGTLGGGDSIFTALNDRNQVLGQSQTASGAWHTFLWTTGVMRDLHPLNVIDLNNLGQILTVAQVNGEQHAVAVNPLSGQQVDLGAVSLEEFILFHFNDAGQVTGISPEPESGFWHPFLWQNGVMTDLMPDVLTDDGFPEAINNRGEVAFQSCDSYCAYVWSNGQRTRVPTPQGIEGVGISGLNNKGQAVGTAYTVEPYATRAYIWSPGGALVLLRTWEGYRSSATGINNQGQIAGTITRTTSSGASRSQAVVWQSANSPLSVLPLPKGYRNSGAGAINYNGVIVGTATAPDWNRHVVMWRPVAP